MPWSSLAMKDPNDYLRDSQIKALENVVKDPRDKTLFFTLLKTGRRVSEVVRSLRPSDINFDENFIVWQILKKKRPIRIPLKADPNVIFILEKYIAFAHIKPDDYIFPISRQRVFHIINKYGKMIGLPKKRCHPHIFRHTFASRALKSGMRIDMVKKLLQHGDIRMTLSYTHFSEEEESEALKKMWR